MGRNPDAWKTAPTDFDQLFSYFTYRFVQLLDGAGFSPAGWEEPWTMTDYSQNPPKKTVRPSEDFLPGKPIYAFNWNIFWESPTPDWTYLLANAGYKTVITPASHLYFDHPEEPDTNERGYYWATRFTDMERTRDQRTSSVIRPLKRFKLILEKNFQLATL